MSETYYTITFEHNNKQFKFEPIQYLILTDDDNRKVIKYKLSYLDTTTRPPTTLLEAIIPYYVSDGHTNHLRANMLYPFMCLSNGMKNQSCPYHSINRLLFKYNIGTNFNTESIHKWIKSEYEKVFPTSSELMIKMNDNIDNIRKYKKKISAIMSSPENSQKEKLTSIQESRIKAAESIIQHIKGNSFFGLILDSKNRTVGITSVLPRLTNLLDYFIAILTPSIITLSDFKCYRPIRDIANKYNMAFCDPTPNEGRSDIYRKNLLLALHDQIIHYGRYSIINFQPLLLQPIPITIDMFNKRENICSSNHTISQNSSVNVANYTNISHLFFLSMKQKITDELSKKEDPQKIHFLTNFNSMLPDNFKYHTDPVDMLTYNIKELWDTDCKKKYLKYKKKYMKLKELLKNE